MAVGGGATALGATVAAQQTHLDAAQSNRWTLDVGARRTVSDAVTLATATHFFSRFATGDASQELYGGLEVRVWHGPLWGTPGWCGAGTASPRRTASRRIINSGQASSSAPNSAAISWWRVRAATRRRDGGWLSGCAWGWAGIA